MTKDEKNYKRLHAISREVHVLEGINSLLDWDQETHMPEDASGIRSEQLQVLAGIIHKRKVSPAFKRALGQLIDIKSGKVLAPSLSKPQQSALREWRRDFNREVALPKQFVEEWAKLTSQAVNVWRYAREQNSFSHFAPYLERIVNMNRKKAEYLGYKDHPYDALLDLYEPEITTKQVSKLFTHLRSEISKLTKKAAARKIDDSFLCGKFDHEKQISFSKLILEKMGYDMKRGRLDLSTHPFSSSSHPTDSRITTRIHPENVMSNISAVMHEAGHALYAMGLPIEHYGSPLGDAISMGMHESQSRWWETFIGHSKPFWSHFLPLMKKHFKGQLDAVTLDHYYLAINKVTPSLIRIEADEVTYSLHVILRFEMEKALIEEKLAIRDVPEAWNAKMKELLNLVPKTNSEGCLQDIHWSMGAFGYFPSYTLGNMYAAHLFEKFAKDHADWEKRVANGELLFIKEWLGASVHQYGRQYNSLELLKKVTGKSFTADAYLGYLNSKYK